MNAPTLTDRFLSFALSLAVVAGLIAAALYRLDN